MNERLLQLKPYPMLRLSEQKAQLRAEGKRVFDFGTGDPDDPTPSFVRQAMIDAIPRSGQYATIQGTDALREAGAGYVRRRFGVELDPATEVLATSGSMEAIFHLPMILVDPSSGRDRVVYGVPGYRVFEIGTHYAEGRAHAVDLTAENGYLLDPDQIGEDVLSETGLVFLNYPHNPTGQELPDELFERWVAARDRHGFVLVSDEVYADIYFERPSRSLLEFGREGCLVIHSLSKRSSMTGYQTGLFAGDADLIATLRHFRASMGLSSPVWTQAAATAAWLDDDHVDDKRALLEAKRHVMLELFQARRLQVYPGTSTLYLWVEVPEGFTDTSDAEHLIERGIVVSPGSNFGPNQERFFRVALAPDVAECSEAAALWP